MSTKSRLFEEKDDCRSNGSLLEKMIGPEYLHNKCSGEFIWRSKGFKLAPRILLNPLKLRPKLWLSNLGLDVGCLT